MLADSARTTAMLFMILVGALVFANFVNYTSMPADLKAFVGRYEISPITVMIAICAIYVILGTAMEELSMILLTVPVFFPLVVHLGFDPVWFGIIIVVVVLIGLISPPVGMNMFVVKSMLPGIATRTIFRGVTPFVVATDRAAGGAGRVSVDQPDPAEADEAVGAEPRGELGCHGIRLVREGHRDSSTRSIAHSWTRRRRAVAELRPRRLAKNGFSCAGPTAAAAGRASRGSCRRW